MTYREPVVSGHAVAAIKAHPDRSRNALRCRSQDDRCELDPLTASLHKLANCVYPKDARMAAAAIASGLSGFGVALYKGVVMELKVPLLSGVETFV